MDSIVQAWCVEEQILRSRQQFEGIVCRMKEGGSKGSLDETERGLFSELLKLGQGLLSLHVAAQGDGHVGEAARGPDGQERPFHSHKQVQYRSVFGEVTIRRAYYWREGVQGWCPLDEERKLPGRKESYLLPEWALRMDLAQSYDETTGGLADLLGLSVPKRQIETVTREVGEAVREFYETKAAAKPKDEGPVLVVEVDGKGVPMKRESPQEAPKRLCKGQKKQKKRMAKVGVIYTSERRQRDEESPEVKNKEVFAELQRREEFGQELLQRAGQREKGVKRKAFLADGEEKIWELQQEYFPQYEGILDWIHAVEYLWKAAYLWLPESSPEAHAWVERH